MLNAVGARMVMSSALQRPLELIARPIDVHVWSAVAKDAAAPGAREVATAMLAASRAEIPAAAAGAEALSQLPPAPVAAAGAGTAAAAAPAASPQALQVVELVNQARQASGLPALAIDPRLTQVAAAHSRQMASSGTMAHEGIGDGTAGERIRAAAPGASRTAENVAMGQADAAAVMRGWMDSPGHRANILDPRLRSIGVEVAVGADGAPYWTQAFTG